MAKQGGGKFISGLVTGLSLGSLAVYFSTPQGKKTWQRLEKEWDQARKELFRKGLIQDQNISLEDFRDTFLTGIKQSFFEIKDQFELLNLKQIKQKEAKLIRKKQARHKKKQQFRGV